LDLWARLQDADHSYHILNLLVSPSRRTYPNLFDAHPPLQIDGNFGGTAGIAETLLQSHAEEIKLLPALPKAWPTGSATDLRARGGFEVDLVWKDGRLVTATIRSTTGGNPAVRCGAKTAKRKLEPGKSLTIGPGRR
jgi:alpha-L-fucosidase 2